MQNKWVLATTGAFFASFVAVMPLAFLVNIFSSIGTITGFLETSFLFSIRLFPIAFIIFSPFTTKTKVTILCFVALAFIAFAGLHLFLL